MNATIIKVDFENRTYKIVDVTTELDMLEDKLRSLREDIRHLEHVLDQTLPVKDMQFMWDNFSKHASEVEPEEFDQVTDCEIAWELYEKIQGLSEEERKLSKEFREAKEAS